MNISTRSSLYGLLGIFILKVPTPARYLFFFVLNTFCGIRMTFICVVCRGDKIGVRCLYGYACVPSVLYNPCLLLCSLNFAGSLNVRC